MEKIAKATLMVAIFSLSLFPATGKAATLSRGAVLGALTDTSVKVWVRTSDTGTFKVEYKTSAGSYPGTFTSNVATSSDDDYTNTVSITGLTADTTYNYRVYVDDVLSGETGATGTFTTMKTAGTSCSYSFALTSDIDFSNGAHTLMALAKARNPLFSIFEGDQIYGPQSGTKAELESYYQDNWGETNMLSFMKDIPGYFMWDDHELPNPYTGATHDWDGGKSTGYSTARTVFDEYQGSINPLPILANEMYYKFDVCDTGFFVLDTRTFRSPVYANDSSNNQMLGNAQLAHLKSWLLNNTGSIKFIVSPSPWPDNVANGEDSFKGFDNERQEIYTFIKQNNIKNVFVLSADQHNTVLYKTDLSNVNKFYEFQATPINSSVQTTTSTLPSGGSTKVCIDSAQSKHYGIVTVDTTASPKEVNFKSYNSSNSIVCDNTITLNDLAPTAPTVASSADQTFNISDSETTMSTMTITDASTATITATNDIRIKIPDEGNMIWDTSITTATIGGDASGKVSTTVSYENSSKTAVINVTTNFANDDAITVAGLKFKTFSSTTARTYLGVDVTNDGGSDSTDTKYFQILPTSGAGFYSSKNQVFNVSQGTQAIQTITVADGSTPAITSANDLRVKIPSGFNMVWDSSDTTATIGGGASGKVSTTVSYEDSDKTLVIDVTSDFSAGDYITISGLSFKTFSGTSSSNNLGIDTNNDGTSDSTDAKTIQIVSATTKVWTGLGNDTLWSNASNWSGQAVPIAGDAVVFDGTNVSDVIVDYTADNLYSISLNSGYTGTVRFTAYAVEGNLGSLTLTSSLTVNSGTLVFEGETHIDGDSSTPSVLDGTGYIITAPTITVGASGTISANGEGFEEGVSPNGEGLGDSSGGIGGSYGGVGGNTLTFSMTLQSTYGSATAPLSLGSGGGYADNGNNLATRGAGGAGGGALKFNVSSSMTVNGTVSANGEDATQGTDLNNRYGAGSGGSIWIAGAGTLSGSGTISANGGTVGGTSSDNSWYGGAGGGGRISFTETTHSFTGTVSVNGGSVPSAVATTGQRGRAGTINFPSSVLNNFTVSSNLTLGNDISYTFGTLTISNGATLTFDSNPKTGTGATISATTININSGGTLSVNGMGYNSGDTNATGIGGTGSSSPRAAGGGYGGRGGDSAKSYSATGGGKYGSATAPVSLGSGSGRTSGGGGHGGGAIKINLSGTMTVDGILSANGTASGSAALERGGGSGGSIWINGGTTTGSGTIRANGGDGSSGGGAGGGGRISLADTINSFTGTLQVNGGARGSASHPGYAGTIAYPSGSNLTVSGNLTLGSDITYNFRTVTISSGGTLTLDTDPTGDSNNGTGTTINAVDFNIASGGTLTATGMGHTDTSGPSGAKGGAGTSNRVGGSGHGGAGGAGASAYGTPAGGSTYDTGSNPINPGSSCVTATTCAVARGGGAMTLNITNDFTVNGNLSANASTSSPASGGSINVTTKNWLGTTGTITATGGSVTTGSGGGGGGLIKIGYVNKTYSGTAPSAAGGTSTGASPGVDGSAGVVTQSALTDSTAPTISSVSSGSITETGATITWLTDELGSSIVDYGLTDSYGSSTTEADTSPRVLSHSVALTGLTDGTTYHYRVRSLDDAGTPNEGTSSDYTFTTVTAPDVTAPVISNIATDPTDTSVQITWDTDESASSFVEYGTTSSYGTTTSEADTSPRVTSHSVTISGLTASTTYHFRLNSNDASSNLGQSSDQTFTTDATPDVTEPNISSISATPSTTSLVITWTTDEASSSIVDYGLTSSYGTTTSESDTSPRVSSHSVTISGLTAGTLYHYRVSSTDASSNTATSSDQTATTSSASVSVSSSNTAGAISVPLPSQTLPPTIPVIDPVKPITPTSPTTPSSPWTYITFSQNLIPGTRSPEVKSLQQLLNLNGFTVSSSGAGSSGKETELYGKATLSAVKAFQEKYNLKPVDGIFGPMTRAKINNLFAKEELKFLPNTEKNPESENEIKVETKVSAFSQNLKLGTSGPEVKSLQQLLNLNGFMVSSSGAGSAGKETELYGKATLSAVKAFQEKYNLKPVDGIFGPMTRAKINELIDKEIFVTK